MNNEQTNTAAIILQEAIAKLQALEESLKETEIVQRATAANLDVRNPMYWKHEDAADAAYNSLNELQDTGLLEDLQALQAKHK